ncbi:hypothetical protein [Enterococcus casseliflavus]|jgi:hypothetical protein
MIFIDWKYRGKYKIKIKTRTLQNDLGGGQEEYQKYWLWQRQKKKMIVAYFYKKNKVPYSRHARKRRKYIKTKVPFRKEVYCVL